MITRATLIAFTLALCAGVGVAPAEAGDQRPCVSHREYNDVRDGWRQVRVVDHFDTKGTRSDRWESEGYVETTWKYPKCSPWGPGGRNVGIGYSNEVDDDPYMRVWIKCPNRPDWIFYDGQCAW